MKLILAQPANLRFQWELDVLLTNIRQFTDMEVVLLFTEKDFTVPIHFREKWGCSVFVYSDRRDDMMYIPSVRPWLLWQHFKAHPEAEQETYLYIDSDVIFREWPDFTTLDLSTEVVRGANCGSYINYDYIAQCTGGGEAIAAGMAAICGITVDQMKGVPGIGAHLILTNPTAGFWERSYYDSNRIYHYLEPMNSNIQKWTAEMWAQLWGWVRDGKQIVNLPDLDFSMATDPIEKWDEFKMMHNAGATATRSHELFYKGQYTTYTPFGKNFDWVSSKYVSKKYVEALQKVVY